MVLLVVPAAKAAGRAGDLTISLIAGAKAQKP
jgi:hypothetical protein